MPKSDPAGYVVTSVFDDPACGSVDDVGYNAARITQPRSGLTICLLGALPVLPSGYVATSVQTGSGSGVDIQQYGCGPLNENLGYNAATITQPRNGLTMCLLSALPVLPSGYVATSVQTGSGSGVDIQQYGCGPLNENLGYNAATITQPRNGMTMCELNGQHFAPTGYALCTELVTRACGPVDASDFNAATIRTAPSTPGLDTSKMIANGTGATSPMVTCLAPASGCSGTLGLQGPAGSGASDAAANATRSAVVNLAEASFRIPAGSTVVPVRLNARGRRLLAQLHTLRARAILTIRRDGSASRTTVRTVTIRAGGLDSAQIEARLRSEIAPRGKAAKIHALLANHGYSLRFTSPTAGRVVIDWYQLSPGAGGGQTRTLIASGARSFQRAGVADMRIGLTASGKRVLKGARRLQLTAGVEFVPAGEYPVTLTRTFTLTR